MGWAEGFLSGVFWGFGVAEDRFLTEVSIGYRDGMIIGSMLGL